MTTEEKAQEVLDPGEDGGELSISVGERLVAAAIESGNAPSGNPLEALPLKVRASIEQLASVAPTSDLDSLVRNIAFEVNTDAALEWISVNLLTNYVRFVDDKIAMAAANRESVQKLISQLSYTSRLMTTLANHFGIEIEGRPVEPSDNFVQWDAPRLKTLAVYLTSHVESAVSQGGSAVIAAKAAELQSKTDKETLQKLRDQIQNDATSVEVRIEGARQEVLRLNEMLGSYIDVDGYVVALLDPLTRKPIGYYRPETRSLKPHRSFTVDAVVGTEREALTLRSQVIRAKRAAARKLVYDDTFSDRVVVMRLSLSQSAVLDLEVEGENDVQDDSDE